MKTFSNLLPKLSDENMLTIALKRSAEPGLSARIVDLLIRIRKLMQNGEAAVNRIPFYEEQIADTLTPIMEHLDVVLSELVDYAYEQDIEAKNLSELFSELGVILASLRNLPETTKQSDSEIQELEIRRVLHELNKRTQGAIRLEEIARTEVSATGVNYASEFFTTFAGERAKVAKNFLRVGAALTLFLVLWSAASYFFDKKIPIPTGQYLSWFANSLPKSAVYILISFAIAFCGRNYRINQHLAVLNHTKAKVLESGQRFIEAVDHKPGSFDVILETLVRSVFTLGETGFVVNGKAAKSDESPAVSALSALAGGLAAGRH